MLSSPSFTVINAIAFTWRNRARNVCRPSCKAYNISNCNCSFSTSSASRYNVNIAFVHFVASYTCCNSALRLRESRMWIGLKSSCARMLADGMHCSRWGLFKQVRSYTVVLPQFCWVPVDSPYYKAAPRQRCGVWIFAESVSWTMTFRLWRFKALSSQLFSSVAFAILAAHILQWSITQSELFTGLH